MVSAELSSREMAPARPTNTGVEFGGPQRTRRSLQRAPYFLIVYGFKGPDRPISTALPDQPQRRTYIECLP